MHRPILMIMSLLMLLVMLFAPPGTTIAAPRATRLDLPNGRFYTDANGMGGSGTTGYAVVDDVWPISPPNPVAFYSEFLRLGEVSGVGYPASRPFMWDGFVSQVMQKGVFQWRADVGRVYFVNVFDEMHKRGMDARLYAELQVPHMADWSADSGRPWNEIVARHMAMLDGYPRMREKYDAISNPLELYGLPMSPVVDFGPFYAVRLQRAVFQQYKVNTSYARAGDVLIANGGDVAKQMQLIPAWIGIPHGSPRWSDRIVVFEPNMGGTVGQTFRVVGDARVFEAHFLWEVRAMNGMVLKRGSAMTASCCTWARYVIDVDLNGIPAQQVVLVLAEPSPATGVHIGVVDVALNYQP